MHAIRYVGSVDARDVSLPYPAYAQLSCWAAYTFTAVGLSTGYRKVGISRVVSSEPSVSWEGMYRRVWQMEVDSFRVLLAAYLGAVFVCCNQC